MAGTGNDLRAKLALITGASGGIGAACAKQLWLRGASLALTYHRHESQVVKLEEELLALSPADGRVISHHQADMKCRSEIQNIFSEIKRDHGKPGPDILVANAGYGKRIPDIEDITADEFIYTINVNLTSAFILSKLSIPYMTSQNWGRIIYVSSIAAHGGGINGCHYAASKAGLTGLMKNLAYKHAKNGITVNDVAPAMIGDTGMIPDEQSVEGTPGDVRNIPVGRLGTPDEVANVVLMFCQTGYMTGQSVLLSGGLK